MNPRTDYSDADTATARAFIHLFIWHDDLFTFGIDSMTPDDEELRAWLTVTNHKAANGNSTIGITGINQQDQFAEVADTVRTMGLTVVEESTEEMSDEEIGDYTANVLIAYADEEKTADAEWNVPCLLVYGSLRPELKEACYEAFGSQFDYHDIRNHYVVVGDGLTARHADTLSDTIGRASYIFDDEKRDLQSDVHTADFV